MINLYSQNGDIQYNILKYIVDKVNDIPNLPLNGAMGSTAEVIETGEIFILNGEKQWVPYQGSSSGGGIASLPANLVYLDEQ